MKLFHLLSMPLMASALLCFSSCGNTSDNAVETAVSGDTTTTANKADEKTDNSVATNTIVTTPQEFFGVRHKVSNFNKWLASYEANDSLRLAFGVHSYRVSRGYKDSNMVIVVTKVDDLNKAKAFAKDAALKKAMHESGVIGIPMTGFTTLTFQDTAMVGTDLRSRTTFKVKDYDVWAKSFDSTRQMRSDNGLKVMAYGHDADNTHNVAVVVAILDTAKAFAFWKSDELKKRLAASGVTSTPERFLYRVVKWY
jgi:heme-degrading monooxygenase HmoA